VYGNRWTMYFGVLHLTQNVALARHAWRLHRRTFNG
jgi:hypothetical protein